MKKKVLAVIILCTLSIAGFGLNLGEIGYSYINSESVPGGSIHQYQRSGLPPLFVDTRGGDIEEIKDPLMHALTILNSLDPFAFSRYTMLFSGTGFELIANPSSFVYQGRDLSDSVPAGLRFYYTNQLDYDFRIIVGNYFLRIQGQFIDETSFMEKIDMAINDPVTFLQLHEPEFIYELILDTFERMDSINLRLDAMDRQVAGLDRQVDALEEEDRRQAGVDTQTSAYIAEMEQVVSENFAGVNNEIAQMEEDFNNQLDRLEAQFLEEKENLIADLIVARDRIESDMLAAQAELNSTDEALQAALTATYEELTATIENLGDDTASNLQAAIEALNAVDGNHDAYLDRLQYSLVYFRNTGFFRGPTMVDRPVFNRVVELKLANEGYTLDTLKEKLEGEGVEISDQELDLIFKIVFGVFEE